MTTELELDPETVARRIRNASMNVRRDRDIKIKEVQWRVERYMREQRLGTPTTESAETMQALDQYVADLCNVPDQTGFPMEVQWPVKPT